MAYDPRTVEGRFLAGEADAVAEVVRWIARVVSGSSFWSLRPEWKDLHQEALGRVLESLRRRQFDPSRDFRTYVQGVARFTALKALGRRSRWSEAAAAGGDGGDAVEPEIPVEALAERSVVAQQLARHVLDLATEECRALLQAFFLEDRSYTEIAETCGSPVGTVKSRVFRCLEAAHRSIAGRGGRLHGLISGNPPTPFGE